MEMTGDYLIPASRDAVWAALNDLDVLKDFLGMLDRVAFVQVEAAMNRYNKSHVQFSVFMDFMAARNFHLLHLYEQRLEFKLGGRPILRRADPVFINGDLVDLIEEWIPDAGTRRRVLVDNPVQWFGF